jgi:hypothetical protein
MRDGSGTLLVTLVAVPHHALRPDEIHVFLITIARCKTRYRQASPLVLPNLESIPKRPVLRPYPCGNLPPVEPGLVVVGDPRFGEPMLLPAESSISKLLATSLVDWWILGR